MNKYLLNQIIDVIRTGNIRHVAGTEVSHIFVGPITLRVASTPKYTCMLGINSDYKIPWTVFRPAPAAVNVKWHLLPAGTKNKNVTCPTISCAEFAQLLNAAYNLHAPAAKLSNTRAREKMTATEMKVSQYLAGLLEKSK